LLNSGQLELAFFGEQLNILFFLASIIEYLQVGDLLAFGFVENRIF
jgi:hypothetical protein